MDPSLSLHSYLIVCGDSMPYVLQAPVWCQSQTWTPLPGARPVACILNLDAWQKQAMLPDRVAAALLRWAIMPQTPCRTRFPG